MPPAVVSPPPMAEQRAAVPAESPVPTQSPTRRLSFEGADDDLLVDLGEDGAHEAPEQPVHVPITPAMMGAVLARTDVEAVE
eukprot:9626449-Alexandrium_andersonii.AAC.1